jgi:hypothetical protein
VQFPGVDIELSKVLHASEAVSVPAPLPASGSARSVTRFTEIWDKGKAAVIVSETSVTDPDGTPLWSTKRSIFARGEGGFGGERGPSTNIAPPDRAPDLEVPLPILPQQALLYRLCRDRNPLHSDPEFAAAAGFPRPILHGLCTYGVACKALVDTVLDGDMSRVHSYGAPGPDRIMHSHSQLRSRARGQRDLPVDPRGLAPSVALRDLPHANQRVGLAGPRTPAARKCRTAPTRPRRPACSARRRGRVRGRRPFGHLELTSPTGG